MPKLSDTIQNWLMQKRDRAYLNRLTGPQLDDLGLSRDEGLRLTASRADTRQRLLAMAAQYGLHASDIDADGRPASTSRWPAAGARRPGSAAATSPARRRSNRIPSAPMPGVTKNWRPRPDSRSLALADQRPDGLSLGDSFRRPAILKRSAVP